MSDLLPLAFEGRSVRVEVRDGAPWFVAKDVCEALELSNPTMALRTLDEDETALSSTEGRNERARLINESGLYTLVLRSRKAVTPGTVQHRFRKWVTAEVLPTLRKTGSYGAPGSAVTAEQFIAVVEELSELRRRVDARSAVLDYVSVRDLLDQERVPSKGRRGLVVRCSARLRSYCAAREIVAKRCAHSGKWLFPVGVARQWLQGEGRRLIGEHRDRIGGQHRLELVRPKPTPN